MADTATSLNFGPQWLNKQFSVPDANGGGGGGLGGGRGGGGGGGGVGPAGFHHVSRGGDHRGGGGGGGGGGKDLAMHRLRHRRRCAKCHGSRNHRKPAGPRGHDAHNARFQTSLPNFLP